MRVTARLPPRRRSLSRNVFAASRRSSTTDTKNIDITDADPMKIWTSNNDSFGLPLANGPKPCRVPHIATAESTRITSVTPRWPNLNAAQIRKGKTRWASGYVLTGDGNQPPRINISVSQNSVSNTSASAQRWRVHRFCAEVPQANSSGANTRPPTKSPSHQVNHSEPKFDQPAACPRHKLMLPMVALT